MVGRLEQICAVKVGLLWLHRADKSANLVDLPIPPTVCSRVEKVVENLHNYLRIWHLRYGNGRDAILSNAIHHISWLGNGKIDELATIRNVLDDETIDINMRFQQACYHSITDRIELLWVRLPKGSFYLSGADNVAKYDNQVLIYWLQSFSGHSDFREEEAAIRALEDAIVIQSINSIKYFWGKLTRHQCVNAVMKSADRLNEMDPFPRPKPIKFLLKNLTQPEAFRFISIAQNVHSSACVNILKALLHPEHPELGINLIKAGVIPQFVPIHEFMRLLHMAVCGVWSHETFCLIWLCSSIDHKDFVVQNWQLAVVLKKLLKTENFAGTKLILEHIQGRNEIVEQLIFSGPTSNLLWHLALERNWLWLDYFLCTWLPKLSQSVLRLRRILGFEELALAEPEVCRILDMHLKQWSIENLH